MSRNIFSFLSLGFFKVITATRLTRCDNVVCFFLYYSEESKSFEDAKKWCRSKDNAYLVIIDNELIQGLIWKFLFPLEAKLLKDSTNLIFFDMKRHDGHSKAWLMNNDSVYLGKFAYSHGICLICSVFEKLNLE